MEDNSLQTTSPCPVGTKLMLVKRDEQQVFEGVDRMMEQLVRRCNGRRPIAIFHADCAIRGKLSFNRILKEEIVAKMQQPLYKDENIPWLGMYGGAELTMLGGRNMIHVFTSSLYVIVERDDKS